MTGEVPPERSDSSAQAYPLQFLRPSFPGILGYQRKAHWVGRNYQGLALTVVAAVDEGGGSPARKLRPGYRVRSSRYTITGV